MGSKFELTDVEKTLLEKIETVENEAATRREILAQSLRERLASDPRVLAIASAAVYSLELTAHESDEYFCQWAHVDLEPFRDSVVMDALLTVLEENHNVSLDVANEAALYGIGPAIVIGHDRRQGLYAFDQDSGKTIASSGIDLDTPYPEVRAKLLVEVERWMQKNGYFPAVVRIDDYGDPIGYVRMAEAQATVEAEKKTV